MIKQSTDAPTCTVDVCDDWCTVERNDHEDYKQQHQGFLAGIESHGVSSQMSETLWVSLERPFLEGLPMPEAVAGRHALVVVSLDGHEASVLELPVPVARSLAAALLRAAERAEGPRLQAAP